MRRASRWKEPHARKLIRRLAAGLAVVVVLVGVVAMPSHASRASAKCKVVSSPYVSGTVQVGQKLKAHHGEWSCP
jgi:hypothetical protein